MAKRETTNRRRVASMVVTLGFVTLSTLLTLGGCASHERSGEPSTAANSQPRAMSEKICPSLPNVPHLQIQVKPSLAQNGLYDVELDVEGQKESCSLTIANIKAARDRGGVVEAPATQTSMTCKLASVGGISSDGSVSYLRVEGTPAKVSIALKRQGKSLGQSSFTPSYSADECGFIQPVVVLPRAPE